MVNVLSLDILPAANCHILKSLGLTLNIGKMMLFEKGWMCKSARSNCVSCQFIANIWGPKAVPYARVFSAKIAVLSFNTVDPFRYSDVGKCYVLAFPCLIVEIWIRVIMPILSMFPYRILSTKSVNRHGKVAAESADIRHESNQGPM